MNTAQNTTPTLTSSWEIWDFLEKEAGLDTAGYDQEIVSDLSASLGIPLPVRNFGRELKRRNITPEEFLGTLLRSIRPYAEMISDLCTFFYLHGVKRTNSEMRVLFDFGNGPEDLGFDLKHFRETLWRYKQATQKVTYVGWSVDELWSLAAIFRDYWQSIPRDQRVADWLSRYSAANTFAPPISNLPDVGIAELEKRIARAFHIWTAIVLECRKHGATRNQLRQAAEATRNQQRLTETDEIRIGLELPSIEEWSAPSLFQLDHDRWPATFLTGVTCYLESLLQMPADRREASPIIQQLDNIFSRLPSTTKDQQHLIQEILEILNLPIWKRRYELFQTWVLSLVDSAVHEYDRSVHHVNGSLVLKFSGSHVATLETQKGRLHLWSELRSPLAKPLGKSRSSNIQPDYTISFEPISDPLQTVIVVECKQYRKPSTKNFSDVLNDYSKGRPNAHVFLLNYGRVPSTLLNHVLAEFHPRVHALGKIHPGNKPAIEEFKNLVRSLLPRPTKSSSSHQIPPYGGFNLIAIDVSGSMKDLLSDPSIVNTIRLLTTLSPNAELFAVDTSVREKWHKADKYLDALLALPRNGSTDLRSALIGFDLTNSLVITDKDGVPQFDGTDNQPLVILSIDSAKSIRYVFNPR